MSLKRAVSFAFLLIANVIMLAHAVEHHHHHDDGGLCIEALCNDCEEAQYPEQCCFDVYVPANKSQKTPCRSHKKCLCEHHLLYIAILTPLYTHNFVDDTVIHFRQNPYVPLLYFEYVSKSRGLRAPPV